MKGLKRDLAEKGLVKTHRDLDVCHPHNSAHVPMLTLLCPGLGISSRDLGSLENSAALQTQPHEASLRVEEPSEVPHPEHPHGLRKQQTGPCFPPLLPRGTLGCLEQGVQPSPLFYH